MLTTREETSRMSARMKVSQGPSNACLRQVERAQGSLLGVLIKLRAEEDL